MTVPKPGSYPGLSREDYDAWEAINFSVLKFLEYSPAHARQQQLHPLEPTPALALGQALHVAVLEPEQWEKRYACGPVGDRRTKPVIEAWKTLEAERPGAIILPPKQFAAIEAVQASALAHPVIHELVASDGKNEVSFCWQDPATSLLCKGRLDRLVQYQDWTVIVDLKTTIDARAFAFPGSCARYDYHVQAAWYLDGLYQLSPRERRFMLIALEKKPPFACAVYELGSASIELGRQKWRQWLDQWAECVALDRWPSYPIGIQPIELPEWAWKATGVAAFADEDESPSSPF